MAHRNISDDVQQIQRRVSVEQVSKVERFHNVMLHHQISKVGCISCLV